MRKKGTDSLLERFPDARPIWACPGPARSEFYAYTIHGVVVVIHEYPDGNGWEAYVPATNGATVQTTLDAIDARVTR
jgi:hypothetical protein